MQTKQLEVTGISCDGCASKVRHALYAIRGVVDVKLSPSVGIAEVRYDEERVSPDHLNSAVRAAGYGIAMTNSGYAHPSRGCCCGRAAPLWLAPDRYKVK